VFIRKNKNRSGSISVQVVIKEGRKNRIIKSFGSSADQKEIERLYRQAESFIRDQKQQLVLFEDYEDIVVREFVETIGNDHLRTVGPQLILECLYDRMGYGKIDPKGYFKHLVTCRITYPGSKLRTIEYLYRHYKVAVSAQTIYRYLDKIEGSIKPLAEELTYGHAKEVLQDNMAVVFYDMTTLYFETESQDDLRKIGYSKDGKHQHPQIMIGLLVSTGGIPIGYEIFEGNSSETKTLIPVLESMRHRFGLAKPVIVADSALLSKNNLRELKANDYEFILGGRIKNESYSIKQQILNASIEESAPLDISHSYGRLIVSYSKKRAAKDLFNRKRGLKRIEAKVKAGKLTKEAINNRGYNKYLKIEGRAKITVDYSAFDNDSAWDGLKGYLTNTNLNCDEIIGSYQNLWQVEKAFRMSKSDLRFRPIFHYKERRIQAHILICFVAYAVYKELERQLFINQIGLSPEKAVKELKEIQELRYQLPKSKKQVSHLLQLNDIQKKLLNMCHS
jgi:hypothetical protein